MTSDEVYSEYMLCAAEKDAAGIDGVYYYAGDYTGIETLESGELEQLIGSSTTALEPVTVPAEKRPTHYTGVPVFFCNKTSAARS